MAMPPESFEAPRRLVVLDLALLQGICVPCHKMHGGAEIERTVHALRMTVRALKAEREVKAA